MADVQVAVGLGREAGADFRRVRQRRLFVAAAGPGCPDQRAPGILAGGEVGIDVADEIRGLFGVRMKLAANLIGGYLVGVAVAVFHINIELPPELKLFFITGFLGALTTFSTFSAEVVHLIQNARYGWAMGTASLHLFGSLLMTGLGIFSIHKLAQ
jgi:CrcB protein